jgi:hypothetical protein
MNILTREQINSDFLASVASLRGKPDNANNVALTAATATAAIDVSTAGSRGARVLPNVRVPQEQWRVPSGYFGRYAGVLVLQQGDRLVVDGRLVPYAVDLTDRLIGMSCEQSWNYTVGFSDVGAPTTTVFPFGANSVQYFRAGPCFATHFRAVASANGDFYWWVAGGEAV